MRPCAMRFTRFGLPAMMLIIASFACGPLSVVIQPTVVPPTAPQPAPTLTPAGPETAPTPGGGILHASGPWLIFTTGHQDESAGSWVINGLWAVNPDGSGLKQLISDANLKAPQNLQAAVSPSGGHIAYISAKTGTGYENLTLHLLSLPGGGDKIITPLTNKDTEPGPDNSNSSDSSIRATYAIVAEGSLAWSPDGTRLAFVGAQDGPTADVYVYTLADGSVERLTSGSSQAYNPTWSPDGKYVVHSGAGMKGIGQGYFNTEGVWAAPADGSKVITLYQPHSSGETFVGWAGSHTFLVYSYASSGPRDLRTFNIDSLQTTTVWSDAMCQYGENSPAEVAFDPASGAVLIPVEPYITSNAPDLQTGMYLANTNGAKPKHISDLVGRDPVWSKQAGVFFAKTDKGAVEVKPDGVVTQLPAPIAVRPVLSPDAHAWLWASDGFNDVPLGLWIGAVGPEAPSQVLNARVVYAAWSPDGQNILFVQSAASKDLQLYRVARPDGKPILIHQDVTTNLESAAWLTP